MAPSRREWVAATRFQSLESHEILAEVIRRVTDHLTSDQAGEAPVVLLDVDSTLYNVECRTHAILQDWLASSEAEPFSRVREKLTPLSATDLEYSLKESFESAGLSLSESTNQKAWELAHDYWWDRFFSNDYLESDHLYEGALDFVHTLYQAGATIVYLTGRDEPSMGEGTRRVFKRDGLPMGPERVEFLLKESRPIDDHQHKLDGSLKAKKFGKIIASFENEPKNVIGIWKNLPDAMNIFVDTVCSHREAEPGDGLYHLKGFR